MLQKVGVKCKEVLVKFKMKIEIRNEDWPPGCLSQRLKIGTRPVVVIGIVSPYTWGSLSGQNSCSRDSGEKMCS